MEGLRRARPLQSLSFPKILWHGGGRTATNGHHAHTCMGSQGNWALSRGKSASVHS